MIRRALVLRPEPGNAQTCTALAAAGMAAVAMPLFEVVPCAWTPPDPAGFDGLLFTSANAVRHAGAALATFAHLPVVAVGAATARAARHAGLSVATVGSGDATQAVAQAGAAGRLLHLAGRDRVGLEHVTAVTVYCSRSIELPPGTIDAALDSVVLLHSPRSAARFATLAAGLPRDRVRLAALSAAVAAAAGPGWAAVAIASAPTDLELVGEAARLAIDP